jgi:autophagy-related protein 101
MNSTHATVTIDIVSLLFLTTNDLCRLNTCIQVLDRQNTREILCALLHAILFHRLFGTIRPQTFEVLDVTMVRLSIDTIISFAFSLQG